MTGAPDVTVGADVNSDRENEMTRPNHVRLGKARPPAVGCRCGRSGTGGAVPRARHERACRAGSARGNADTGRDSQGWLQSDPTALDPQKQSLTAIWHVIEHIYDGLTRIKPDLPSEPALAEGWEISEDGTSYMFVLREGVTFHDGTRSRRAT